MYSNERVKVKSRESSTLTISRIYIHMYILKNSDDAISRYFHPDLERIGTVFRFPLLRQDRERELEIEEKKNAKEKKERKKVLGIGHDRAHVRISRLRGGLERLKIPDRHVFAAYKSTTFQRSRCSAIRCEGAYVRNDRWIFSND